MRLRGKDVANGQLAIRSALTSMLDLLVTGGAVVTPEAVLPLDIGVRDGRIAVLGARGSLTEDAAQRLDATGRTVLPGGIEPHCHIEVRLGAATTGIDEYVSEPVNDATRAAAFGGVTTLIDFVLPGPDGRSSWRGEVPDDFSVAESAETRRELFHGQSYIDYSFHFIVHGLLAGRIVDQIGEAVSDGIASFKVFMVNDPMRVRAGDLWTVFGEVARRGGIMAVHAEDNELVEYMRRRLADEHRDGAENMPLVHSKLSEDLSFRYVTRLAERTEAALYLMHTSASEGVAEIARARAAGQPVYGETLHNYMEFTCDHYQRPDGTTLHTYPSLKYEDDRRDLVDAVANGVLSTTATDHIATSKQAKLFGRTVTTVCGGHNGIETRLPVTYTRFVAERGMSLTRFADISATNAAKIFGLYPRKGAICVGGDADLAVWVTDVDRTITLDGLHGAADYNIWDGFVCRGYPATTVLRGKVVVDDGRLLGAASDGRWVPQRIAGDVLARPVV